MLPRLLFVLNVFLFYCPISSAQSANTILNVVDSKTMAATSRIDFERITFLKPGQKTKQLVRRYSRGGNSLFRFEHPGDSSWQTYILKSSKYSKMWKMNTQTKQTHALSRAGRDSFWVFRFFSNEWTVGEFARNWHGTVAGEDTLKQTACFILSLVPTKRGPKMYSRAQIWVDKKQWVPLKMIYYDLKGKKQKQLELGNYHKLDGVHVPFFFQLTNLTNDRKNILKVQKAFVNLKLNPTLFQAPF